MSIGLLDPPPEERRADIRRWALAGMFVLAAHSALIAGYLVLSTPDRLAQGAPVLMVDLAPLPSAPTQAPSDPAQTEPESAPEPEMTQTAEPKPEPDPEPVHTAAEPPPPPDTPPQTPPAVAEIPPPLQTQPEVPLPAPTPPPPPPRPEQTAAKPRPPQPERKRAAQPQPKKPIATRAAQAPAQSTAPTASRIGISAEASAAQASWRELLIAHLQRNKRYPSGPQQRREQGTATLSFTMDRAGRVVERHLANSSGNAELDAEVLAMITRAQPLPAFPPSMAQARMTLSVPIRFSLR
jgi:periplasmic protein TonB